MPCHPHRPASRDDNTSADLLSPETETIPSRTVTFRMCIYEMSDASIKIELLLMAGQLRVDRDEI